MKGSNILVVLFLLICPLAHGQGQFVFNNRVGDVVNARFVLIGADPSDGSASSIGSPDWTVQLFGGPIGTPVSQLIPLDPAGTSFRGAAGSSTAGYVVSVSPIVPNVAPGSSAYVLVKLVGPGGLSADFGPYTVESLGGETVPPPNLLLGTTPLLVVPEPSGRWLITLGIMGLGCVWACQRRLVRIN